MIPPPNFGAVKDGTIFRSAFPQDRNLDFLRKLDIRTVLCLVDTEPSASYTAWLGDSGIERKRIDIAPNKDGKVKTTWDSLSDALLFVMDAAHYPLYIHCNQGRHRTGCLVACYRKIQRWPIEKILAEYDAYSSPKARTGDVDLIKAFQPDKVFEYAKQHGFLNASSSLRRMDSTIVNIDMLAEALASTPSDSYSVDWDMTAISSASSNTSDNGLEIGPVVVDPSLTATRAPAERPGSTSTEPPERSGESETTPAARAQIVETPPFLRLPPGGGHNEATTTTTVMEVPADLLSPPETTASMTSMDIDMAERL